MSFFFLNPHSKCFMFRKQLHHKSKLKLPRCKIQDKIIYSQSISKNSSKNVVLYRTQPFNIGDMTLPFPRLTCPCLQLAQNCLTETSGTTDLIKHQQP